MAKDDIGHIASGSDLKEDHQQENEEECGAVDSIAQVTPDGRSIEKTSGERVKLRTFMFSRSAETVGYPGADSKQTGQRPDRLHARRLSTSRRGGTVEQTPSVLRYAASSKTTPRHTKTNNIRTSKSCTKECEIVRADYTNDYSAAYSTFYDDILRAAEESDTFTGIGEDVQGSDQEDVTLSESTALIIDNGDLEAKSDITISSHEEGSSSLHCDNVVQSSTNVCNSGHERPGACRCRPTIDSSDERLDSDVSDRQQLKAYAGMDAGNQPQACRSWTEEDQVRAKTMYSEQTPNVGANSLEQSNPQPQINKDKATLQFSAESTRVPYSPVTTMSPGMNKHLLPSSTLPIGNIISLKDRDTGDTRRSTNHESPGPQISRVPRQDDQKNTPTSLSMHEVCRDMNQLDDDLLSLSSSRPSLHASRTTPVPQATSEKHPETSSRHSHQGRQKAGSEKRTPYPEELAIAVTKAFNSGQFHLSQIVAGKENTPEYSLETNQGSKTSLIDAKVKKCTGSDIKTQVRDLSEHHRGDIRNDSPGISILSFNLVKEISETAMPQRRDHNDVILGDNYSSSRSGTPLSPIVGLRPSISGEAAETGRNGDLTRSSPHRVSSAAKGSDTPSTCEVDHANKDCISSFCVCPCIEEYPQLSDEYTSQARLATESPHRGVFRKSPNEMYHAGDSGEKMASTDPEFMKSILKLRETTGSSPGNAKADGSMITSVSKSGARSLVKSSVPPLGSHEYLPFLNKLRQEKRSKSRQQKINKSQRKVSDTGKKNTSSQEEDCHGDADSVSPTPLCPVGREVPADWRPGEHAFHPLTKLSASYTPARKVKKRRSIRRKKRVQMRLSPRKKDKESVAPELNRHVSNFEVNVNSPPSHVEASKSCSVMNAYELGSTDTDGNPEDDVLASFEYKRRYYERLSKLVKDDSGSDSKSEHSPVPKRVTSQVRLLKTLDELYSSASSDEAEGELPFTDQPLFDICHQTSLFNYYTRRLRHMSVLGSIPQGGESASNNMSYIRIRKVEQEVPSALDHKRLKSLYECRMKKPALTSKIRKMEHIEQARCRNNEKSDGMTKSVKQMHAVKGYGRAACRVNNCPKITNNKSHGRDMSTDVEESEQSTNKERTLSHDETKTTLNAYSGNTPHRSYLDILKSNIHHPFLETKHHFEYNSQASNSNSSRQKSAGAPLPVTKEALRPLCNDLQVQKTPPLRDRESTNRARMKVRFADPCNEYKERAPYEMSDEDTWCSTVNAMLLRANRVMDDVSRNDHRYPKPDSARVVSPVPPKSPTFLKELLKQDTIERKQAKGHTRLERRSKDPIVKQEKPGTRHGKSPTPLAMFAASGNSFLAMQPKGETAAAKNNSSLVYSVPIQDGTDQANVNEKSAGVLKISIQMSKRAQERAWLTHERIKRQRATHAEYDMKSEMKALPKKLTPLRISKPINFQNPDSRNLERIPMRDVLSKTLMGLSTSSQQIFQPRATAPESSRSKQSNFLLDQHSETLRYFRGPYMHQRSSSIVPLFSDSNNNAYLRAGAEADAPVGDNQDDSHQPDTSPHFNQDMFAVVHVNEGSATPENCEGSCTDDEETSSKRHAAQSSVYCEDGYNRERNQHSSEAKVEYHNISEALTSVNAFLTGRHSQSSNGLTNTTSDQCNQPSSTDDNMMTTPFSVSKYITVTIQPKETYQEAIKSKTGSSIAPDLAGHAAGSNTSKKVYITGMSCFENVDNYKHSKNAHENNDNTEHRRNIYNEQSKAIEVQFGTQETLLEALLGYEIERKSKVPSRTAEADSKQIQSIYTGIDNDTSQLASVVDGVPEQCNTCYLHQWAPNYLENVPATEKSPALASPEADQTGCQARSDEVDNEELSIRSCSQSSHDTDSIDVTLHFQGGICSRNEGLDTAEEETPDCRHQVQSPRSASKPRPQKMTDPSPRFNNFAVLGSTISLAEKRSRPVSIVVAAHTREPSSDKALPPSHNQVSYPAGNMAGQSSRLDGQSHNCKKSVVGVTSLDRQIKEVITQRLEQAKKHMNTSLVKQPGHNVPENKRTTAGQRPIEAIENFKGNSPQNCNLYADAIAAIDVEDLSMNKTYCRHFNWAQVKIPPSFTKDAYVLASLAAQETATRTETSRAYSTYSVYSNSTVAQYLEEEAADNLGTEEASKCVHMPHMREDMTPNIFDSILDPPNSVCTTTNLKDMTSSMCTNDVEVNNVDHVARPGRTAHAQGYNLEDTLGGSITQQTTEAVCEIFSERSRTSDVEGGGLTESPSLMTASCRSLDDISTISQISYPFDDDQDQKAALNDSPDDALNWESDIEEAVLKDAVDASDYKVWHNLRETLKLGNACQNKNVQAPLRDTVSRDGRKDTSKTDSGLLDRDFLKTLRNTDLLHTVTMDRRRLLRSLQLMTRRQGYLPMFQVRSRQAMEMMPQIVVLNHCAKTFIERGSSSFSGTVRCLPIFYTADDTGFITSIYTVNWIPEGVYSFETSNMETINSGLPGTGASEQARFGKLLQYSPFASDLAFANHQAYLIGDEVTSREEAAKTLTVAHDEAAGDVAKYFMLMCGWIPPNLNRASTLPIREAAIESNSEKTETNERYISDNGSSRQLSEEVKCLMQEHHLPAIGSVADCAYSEKCFSKVTQDKMPSLPHQVPVQLVARSNNQLVESKSQVSRVCQLPAICKRAGIIAPEMAQPTLMLCLRCGAKVDQAQTEDVSQHIGVLSSVERQTRTTHPTQEDTRTSQEGYSPKRCSRRNCLHNWEVSELGLALPLVTTRPVNGPVRGRNAPLHSDNFRKRLKISLQRTTKSQTACERKNEFDGSLFSLPQVRSQSDIFRSRCSTQYIDTPAHGINQTKELTQRNVQTVGSGSLPPVTPVSARENPDNRIQVNTADKENSILANSVKSESPAVGIKAKTPTRINDVIPRQRNKSPATVHKLSTPPLNQKSLRHQAPLVHQTPVRHQAPFRHHTLGKQIQQLKEATLRTASALDKDKQREVDPLVAGWNWNTAREGVDEEQYLMEKRTWSQPVIPPPFPGTAKASPGLKRLSYKPNARGLHSSKAHLAKHRRNLNQISQSYVSPYWAKKEIKRARSKTPASDSGDDHSSISRITTISGMSSTSSESNTDVESSTEESECDTESSASGSDFFSRYANKGGPTSVDDIFKRTLPRQRLDFKLARLKDAKEKEELEQLGYLRGREGVSPPVLDHGDNAKENEHSINFVLSDYDMCSDADEMKELWKQCFPEIDFWDRKRRKKFKKTKILS